MIGSILEKILTNDIFITGLVGLLVTGTGYLFKKVGGWLGAKTDGTKFENVVAQLLHSVETAVLAVEQTLVPEVVKAKADGKITDEEKSKLFGAAHDAVMKMLGGDAALAKLAATIKTTPTALDAMICNMIEAAVKRLTK